MSLVAASAGGIAGESCITSGHPPNELKRLIDDGSPVYVYRTFGSDLTHVWGIPFYDIEIPRMDFGSISGRRPPWPGHIKAQTLFGLLGIHWAQFPERWELRDRKTLTESRKHLIVDGAYVEGYSGMTCVIPSWDIMDVFDMPELKKLRHPGIMAAERKRETAPKPEVAPRDSDEENPNHQ